MTPKMIILEILAYDEHEAEGLNESIGYTLERENWRVYAWTTQNATDEQISNYEWDLGEVADERVR